MQVSSLAIGFQNFLELKKTLSEENFKILEDLHISVCDLKEVGEYTKFHGYMEYVQRLYPHIDYNIVEDSDTEFRMEFKIDDTKHLFYFIKPKEEKK